MPTAVHQELELKSVVPDPAQLRARLRSAGAMPGYAGLLRDRRYDRDGSLSARDEVLRVREYRHADGSVTAELTWKGPTRRSPEGYKQREEIELAVGDSAARRLGGSGGERLGGSAPDALLRALGYEPVQTIDRWIETYQLEGASVRLEWYPRMDVLVEVEGDPEAIERAIAGTGLHREGFTAEPLVVFAERFRARGGAAVLALAELGGAAPTWEQR
jgi:adenylate cyclase class IV